MKKKLIAIIMVTAMAVTLGACEMDNATDKKTSAVQTEDKDKESTTENNSDNKVVDNEYEFLDEFISLVCSYSDPPNLEGDAYQQYFKEEYKKWCNGEGYECITKDSEGRLVIIDHTSEYAGIWQDTYSGRCYMEISSADGVNFEIDINWADSSQANVHWSLYGQYDEKDGGIHYYGSKIYESYTDDGDKTENVIYTDGEGIISKGEDGIIYWNDYVEQRGENCTFARSE